MECIKNEKSLKLNWRFNHVITKWDSYCMILTYVHAYMYMRTCVHAYIRTCVHTYMRTCVHAYIRTYVHAYMYMRTCVHVHAYMRTYVHAYIRILSLPDYYINQINIIY